MTLKPCPYCGSQKIRRLTVRRLYECLEIKYTVVDGVKSFEVDWKKSVKNLNKIIFGGK